MKYPRGQRRVQAIYDKDEKNPFLAALPPMLTKKELFDAIESRPTLPTSESSSEKRRAMISELNSFFLPMDFHYAIYDMVYRAIGSTYKTRDIYEQIRKINALYNGVDFQFATAPNCGSILGVPGIGKTSTIKRILTQTIPQTITHNEIGEIGKEKLYFRCTQVNYLFIECSADCSIKMLCHSLISALSEATGANIKLARSDDTASALATEISILFQNFAVGCVFVDEIQNAVTTARKNRQIKSLVKFMVQVMNDTNSSFIFIGVPESEELFLSQEHLKRRTRGLRLLPFKPDGAYRHFLSELWKYQYLIPTTELTDSLSDSLYNMTAGIPSYLVKLFTEVQVQCLLSGYSRIDTKILRQTANLLAIEVPKVYSGGTYISDFSVTEDVPEIPPVSPEGGRRLYANKRGRKPAQRDASDLIVAFKTGISLESLLKLDLVEDWTC